MKKIIQIILICLILAGIIIIATIGFNVGLKYSANTQIDISIGKEFEIKDIKEITSEIFQQESVIIQKVELYKDMVQITVKEVSDEQIETLNNKINEKYGIENQVSDISVSHNANTRLRDIIKPYILPIAVTSIIIAIYACIRFYKLGLLNVIYKICLLILGPQAILSAIYAITRLPITNITLILGIGIYVISIIALAIVLLEEKQKSEFKEEKNLEKNKQ